MSDDGKRYQIGHGLPRCIADEADGFERLKSQLGVNRDSCRKIIESAKKRIPAFPKQKLRNRLKSSERDRSLLFEFYEDKNRRHGLWEETFSYIQSDRELARILPSLEYHVLMQYLDDYDVSTPDWTRCTEVFGAWPDLVEHLKEGIPWAGFAAHVWSTIRDRMNTESWASLESDQRIDLTLVTFAVATIVDDERLLRAAIKEVPELETEFHNLLHEAESSDTTRIDDVLERWNTLCKSLQSLSAKAGGDPPAVDVLSEIEDVVAELGSIGPRVNERCVSMLFDQLPTHVDNFLEYLENDPDFSWLGETERTQVRARWRTAQHSLTIDQIRDELARLNEKVAPAIEAVRHLAAKLSHAHAQHDSLSKQPQADSLVVRHRQEEMIENAQMDIHALSRNRRQAQHQLLSLLCPLGAAFDMDPPDPPPLPSQDPPPKNEAAPQKTESGASSPELADPAWQAEHQSYKPPDDASVMPATEDSLTDELIPKTSVEEIFDVVEPVLLPTVSVTGQIASDDEANENPLMNLAMSRITEALSENPPRLAYAFQVGRLLTLLDMDSGQPPITALLEAAMLSDRLTEPDGAIAAEVKTVLARARFPSLQSLGHTDDARDLYVVLALAATLRPALLSPDTGAYAVLSALQPTERLTALYQLTRAIANEGRSLQGVRVDSTMLEIATSRTEWREHRDRLTEEAREWRHKAMHMTMKYAAATIVWLQWLSPEGPIARMLELIISCTDDTASITKTRDQLTDQRDFRALVRDTDRKIIGRRAGKDIYAGALKQLSDHAQRAVDFADRYLNLLKSRPSKSPFTTKALTNLLQQVKDLGPPARDQLQELGTSSTFPLLTGAANTAIYAIARFRELFEVVPDSEPDPKALVGSGLFHFPSIRVDNDGRSSGAPGEALRTLISTESETLRTSFHRRLDMHDFATSRRIIDWISTNEDDDTQDLQDSWNSAFDSEKRKLHNFIDDTRTKVSIALAHGHISDHDRDMHEATLVEIEQQATDFHKLAFDDVQLKLRDIIDLLEIAAEDRRREAMRDLEDLDLSADSAEHRDISALIIDGEILEANEIIARIRIGSSAAHVSPDEQREIFRDFFPERCVAIASATERSPKPSGVLDALASDAEFGGVVFNQLPDGRRKSAQQMLQAWFDLKRTNRLDDAASRQRIATLFGELGFNVQRVFVKQTGRNVGEAHIRTTTSRTRDRCRIPAFGSAADGRYRIVFRWDHPTAEDMLQHAEESPRRAATILLYFGCLTKTQRDELAVLARKRLRSLLVVDESLLIFLCGERDSRVPIQFACTIPFTYAQPYVTTASVVPPEMFYGREDEMHQIADPNGSCFIYGGRQLGKTALLKAVETREHRPTDGRYAIWIDLKGEGIGYDRDAAAIWLSIWRALRKLDPKDFPLDSIDEPTKIRNRIDNFMDLLTNHFQSSSGRVLLLLLDEADKFLEVDAREVGSDTGTGYRESSRLKTLMDQTARSIKVVFAGLHNVLRTVEYSNHPLGHFGQPIQVGPLWQDAEALIRQPLLASGYRFENDNLVTRILAQTNYYPNLIQLYCSEIVKSICSRPITGGPLYDISETVVDETYQSANLQEIIRQRFHMTLQLDPRYEVIAYAIAHECNKQSMVLSKGLEYREIEKISRYWWTEGFEDIEPYTDLFRSLLDEMVGLGVLRKAGDFRYTLRNPNVLPFMGTPEEIERNLYKDRELRQQFQPALFRAHDPKNSDGPSRSPLTYEQEGRLRGNRNGVSVVCGLKWAGYDDVLRFLRQREASYVELAKSSNHLEFGEELDGHLKRRSEGTTIYAVPDEVPWSASWVRRALQSIKRLLSKERYARVLFMAEPSKLFQLLPALDRLPPSELEWVPLRPWRKEFLHQWMDDVGCPDERDIRREMISRTGGWPILLTRLHNLVPDKVSWNKGMRDLDGEMTDLRSSDSFLCDFGLDDSVRKKVLLRLAQLEGADFAGLEAVVDDDGIDADSLHSVLKWAELLHLVRRVDEDSWEVDGVVAQLLTSGTVEG